MFNKDKNPAKIHPAGAKQKNKPGIVTNKDAETNPRKNKESKQEKSDMQSEGGQC